MLMSSLMLSSVDPDFGLPGSSFSQLVPKIYISTTLTFESAQGLNSSPQILSQSIDWLLSYSSIFLVIYWCSTSKLLKNILIASVLTCCIFTASLLASKLNMEFQALVTLTFLALTMVSISSITLEELKLFILLTFRTFWWLGLISLEIQLQKPPSFFQSLSRYSVT